MISAQETLLKALQSELSIRQAKNSSYSLRSYARYLGVYPSTLSEVLTGKRGITRRLGAKLIPKLSMAAETAHELYQGLSNKNSKTTVVRDSDYTRLERETFQLISDWHYFAILSLAETNDFQDKPSWISKRLGIAPKAARKALTELERLELLSRSGKNQTLRPTGKRFSTSQDISDIAIRRSHHQNLELASRALDEAQVHLRDFSFINLAIDLEKLPEAKKRIIQFRRELGAFLESGKTRSEVYRVAIQLFPLSQRPNRRSNV